MDIVLLTKSSTPIIGWFAEILGFIMNLIFDIGITNIGIAIIVFTIVINVIMIPLTIKQQKSQMRCGRLLQFLKHLVAS